MREPLRGEHGADLERHASALLKELLAGLLGDDTRAVLQPVRWTDDESLVAREPRDDLDGLPEVTAQLNVP